MASAAGTSAGSATPIPTFSSTDSANRNASWNTSAAARANSAGARSSTGWPPMRTVPLSGSSRPTIDSTSVDLPAPVGPTSATVSPASTSKVASTSTSESPWRTERPSTWTVNAPSGREPPPPRSSVGWAITRSTRSSETTERGISSRKNPNTRSGMVSRPKSVAARTRSPAVASPRDTSQLPTRINATIPTLGNASMTGSNAARSRPTRMRA